MNISREEIRVHSVILLLLSLMITIDIVLLAYYSSTSCNELLSYDCNYNKGICEIESYEISKDYKYIYNISCYNLCNNGYYEYNMNTIKYLNMTQIYYKNGTCQFDLDYVYNNHMLLTFIIALIILTMAMVFIVSRMIEAIKMNDFYKIINNK